MSLNINIKKYENPDFYEVTPIGEIDINTSPELKTKVIDLIKKEKMGIKLNCKELNYLDSTGLGVLISILKETKEQNTTMKIENLKPNIYKLFDITGLINIFNIE